MDNPSVIRVRSGADLLSCIPHRLGFTPRNSVVVLSVIGPRGRLGVAARLDLPHLRHPQAGPELAAYTAGVMADDGAQRAVIVRYPGAGDPPAHLDGPVRMLAGVVAARVERIEVWEVGEGRYAHLDARTWRPEGEAGPAERLRGTVPAAAFAAAGSAPAASREALNALPGADRADVRRARRAASRAWDQRIQGGTSGLVDWRSTMLDMWRATLEAEAQALRVGERAAVPDSRVLGEIAAGVNDPAVRDAVIATIAGEEDLANLAILHEHWPAARSGMGALLDPRTGTELDEDRGEAAERLLTHAAVRAISRRKGQLFGVVAWVAWTRGDGPRAALACDRAAECPGQVQLAQTIDQELRCGLSPRGSARARRVLGGGGYAA
ncbi:MAG: DUF4192 domain-containing protein [Bifidobacteriaceae bacterium]|jgi:hypothetical protein|nr:DUF4192 domain-containing protein [Bifidobacteriaceae bacterium]